MSAHNKSFLVRAQLWVGVILVLGVQVACIFWLGQWQPPTSRPAAAAPGVHWVGSGCAELLEVLDPTLFALPHERGFSGAGWLIPPVQEIQPFAWTEPPRWLALPVERLGTSLDAAPIPNELAPALVQPGAEPLLPRRVGDSELPQRSGLLAEGGLAARRLLTTLDLPSWPNTELVSNSIVQLTVDADGLPFSVALLGRSGHEAADKYAVEQARRARFEPAHEGDDLGSNLVWGTLVFEWHTVPVRAATPAGKTEP